jgi:hypothetical protein
MAVIRQSQPIKRSSLVLVDLLLTKHLGSKSGRQAQVFRMALGAVQTVNCISWWSGTGPVSFAIRSVRQPSTWCFVASLPRTPGQMV